MDKMSGMLQDNVSKIGLRLGKSRLDDLTKRQIKASRQLSNPPVSQFSLNEKFVLNEGVVAPLKVRLDTTKTPQRLRSNQHEEMDFVRYSRRGVMHKSPTSRKVFHEPLTERERHSPKFGKLPEINIK